MVTSVDIEITIMDTRDYGYRYIGISVDAPLPCDYTQWRIKTLISNNDVGKKVMDIRQDLTPGDHKLYINITDYQMAGQYGLWQVKYEVKTSTGTTLVYGQDWISKPGPCYGGGGGNLEISFNVPPGVSTTEPGDISADGTTETSPNWEEIYRILEEKIMPEIIRMMGMVMMMQAMMSMMTTISGMVT